MKPFPRVSIVVLNYNGKDDLRRCLISLFRLNYPNFEVVVVDNASEDGSLEEAKQFFPKVSYIKNDQNLGFSAGNNVGIRYSLEKMADFVLLLNNDTEVEENFLTKIVDEAQKNPKAGLVSPLILAGSAEDVWFSGAKIDWLRMRTLHTDGALDALSGCAMLIRAEVFAKIGLFDEDFFLYWEDTDFSLRARRAGFESLLVREAVVRHFEKSEKNKKNKTYWLVLSGLIFFQKNSSNYLKAWYGFYVYLRKIKNKLDLRKDAHNEIAQAVEKAYRDFKQFRAKQ
jgi:hypothetical protein